MRVLAAVVVVVVILVDEMIECDVWLVTRRNVDDAVTASKRDVEQNILSR